MKLLSLEAVVTEINLRYFTFYPHRVDATISQKNLRVASLLLRKKKKQKKAILTERWE